MAILNAILIGYYYYTINRLEDVHITAIGYDMIKQFDINLLLI